VSEDRKADPELYDFEPYRARPKLVWPGGKTCASGSRPTSNFTRSIRPAIRSGKSWTKPHPDVVGYGHRDHANRVGHWRMAEMMSKHGFPGSVSLSVALCDHIPEWSRTRRARLGVLQPRHLQHALQLRMDERQERAIIEDSIRTVEAATGAADPRLARALPSPTRRARWTSSPEYGLDYTVRPLS
jgi:hypothetical protein